MFHSYCQFGAISKGDQLRLDHASKNITLPVIALNADIPARNTVSTASMRLIALPFIRIAMFFIE